MPANNQFRHQTYTSAHPTSRYRVLTTDPNQQADQLVKQRLREAGEQYRAAGVRTIYLVHGTFFGNDALGLIRELARFCPQLGPLLRGFQKRLIDRMVGDIGNYDEPFLAQFREGINGEGLSPIEIKTFHWSSENLHGGRANAAVQLLLELVDNARQVNQGRTLLWGHSHAGNVFALLTNLLGSNQESRKRFFDAARPYYGHAHAAQGERPTWQQAEQLLTEEERPLGHTALDLVTFGTPIRYGWDTNGFDNLMHVVFHRPQDHLPEYRAPFPPTIEQVNHAVSGDLIHQIGIAGTNLTPPLFSCRAWLAESKLSRLLQSEVRRRHLWKYLCYGQRVPADGETYLIDYGKVAGGLPSHLAGHAIYTRQAWLPYHAELVAEHLYNNENATP